ncbi:MAG: hypothetical protein Q9184_001110 [Pyrenodesmia sp. 2 TL-2023]
MESSRVFVRGLPPQMTSEQFERYFSKQSSITDARLIPHRRIGYVGYKTPEDASKAVKYHNKSFINMSKIHVELAHSFTNAGKQQVDQENMLKAESRASQKFEGVKVDSMVQPFHEKSSSLKRKREDGPAPERDPKLQEYLRVMQPASKSRTWANEDLGHVPSGQQDVTGTGTGTTQRGVVERAKSEEDDHKALRKKKNPWKGAVQAPPTQTDTTSAPIASELVQSHPATEATPPVENSRLPPATDDDWLRSRTSRLLGLVDDVVQRASKDIDDGQEVRKGEASGNREERPRSRSVHVAAERDVDALQPNNVDVDANPGTDAADSTEPTTNRLFVRNLPYTATVDDLRQHFEHLDHGTIEEVHVPVDPQSGKNKGIAYIQYSEPEAAMKALQDLDARAFQGRLLHVIYSAAKRQSALDEIAISKLPLKKQQQIKRKAEAASSRFNWNSMYMNADAVMASVADRLGVPKSELLDPTSADAAVKQAHAETHIIQETKSYFSANGVDLDAFKRKDRGETAILIKNFSYGTKPTDLQELFEAYGTTRRLLMPPSGTMAIVDFVQADHARTAFRSLAYRKFKESILFLEKAPKDIFSTENRAAPGKDKNSDGARGAKHSAGDLLQGTDAPESINTSTLFVRNLNFSTTSERLREVFKPLDGLISARVKTKPDPKHAGKLLSMGFGFLEFRSKEQAQAALAAMDGHNLDGHELLIRASHKGVDAAEDRRREDTARKISGRKTKIVIKNLPFEASKKDVRSLFGSYGQLRSVRVPKKFDSSTRGFAFAEFVTAREAENAMDALKDTHLLGRRLVLDFAAEDEVDPEREIAKMQQKAGKQADKVALQRLTGSSRKKFNVGNEDVDRG